MFGALNRFIARLDAAPEDQQSATNGAFGFQVLRNNNPEVPLEPWFDFIIGINGRTIDNADPTLFATEVRNCGGRTISLGVFTAKGQKIREIYLPISVENPTLGVSLQWTPLAVTEDVWHILDVIPDSPADLAGLLPYGDYVIGSPEGLLRGETGLGEIIEDYLNRPLRLFVYNHEYNVTRPVTLTPSRNWGGEGALGCVLGFGALHRIPASLEEPPEAPGETLFSTGSASFDEKRPVSSASNLASTPGFPAHGTAAPSELFVPANMALPGISPPPQAAGNTRPPKKAKQRAHYVPSSGGGGGLDDYFKEGEEKSAKEDYAPKGSGGAPPPPKVGGPPRAGPPKSATPVPSEEKTEDAYVGTISNACGA
ncbi:golgi reassembly stacking protein-like protein [Massarina eburnea CBS 473.64]|uniref:Golgi reassembly stacking protein-like protein n=1 Tax=Massarina eburnea CBS 473.64 TaxID=1395130 RepID=A0A6A6S075_9PLEO|nr:golgi reassembly stacking protein-like protein [Massarina eburnea CBS 473.64]